MKKLIFGLVLLAFSATANAVTVHLIVHNKTSSSGTISTLITDGSHIQGFAASTVVWDWDGATLISAGLYSTTISLGSSPFGPTILNDNIVDLSIDTGLSAATATSYTCNEGTFLTTVGANGCGDYTLGGNFLDDSTTVWTGLTATQTIGGDDVAGTSGPRLISAYDFGLQFWDGTSLVLGNGVALGDPGLAPAGGGEVMCFSTSSGASVSACDISSVPVPAAVWLFGSALGLLGWIKRRTSVEHASQLRVLQGRAS